MSLNQQQGGGRYHIETSQLISGTNQWTVFYMITASVMKELIFILIQLYEMCGVGRVDQGRQRRIRGLIFRYSEEEKTFLWFPFSETASLHVLNSQTLYIDSLYRLFNKETEVIETEHFLLLPPNPQSYSKINFAFILITNTCFDF